MNKFIGEKLVMITLPWDGDCDEIILEFESGTLRITACDYSEPGQGGCASLAWEEA